MLQVQRFLGLCLLLASCGSDERVSSSFPSSPGSSGTAASGSTAGGSAADGSTSGAGTPPTFDAGITTSSAPADGPCEKHVVTSLHATPDMLIVLDRSGSMNPDNNDDNTDRWGGSRMAVIDVTAAFDDQIRFGLMTFPGGSGQTQTREPSCVPGALDVPIDLSTGSTIATTLQGMDANGHTPTAATLMAALPVIAPSAASPDDVIPPRYVLLVTDGDPNCSGASGGRGGGPDQLARTQTIEAIDSLTAAGVKTFVVGYQTAGSDFADQLDRMAAAGGTGATMHTSVESGDDLYATLSSIASNIISCSYQLESTVSDASKVLVEVAARPRNLNQADDGWKLEADQRTVTLLGAACDEVQNGAVLSVQVTCEAVPLF